MIQTLRVVPVRTPNFTSPRMNLINTIRPADAATEIQNDLEWLWAGN